MSPIGRRAYMRMASRDDTPGGCFGRLAELGCLMIFVYLGIPALLIGTCVCVSTVGNVHDTPGANSRSAPGAAP